MKKTKNTEVQLEETNKKSGRDKMVKTNEEIDKGLREELESQKKASISMSKEELQERYKKVRNAYGDRAKSTGWMQKNGYSWFCKCVRDRFGSWGEFKKQAGFDDPLKSSRLSNAELIEKYQKIREEYGDQAKSCQWLRKNGYSWFDNRARQCFGSWGWFKKQAGFNDSSSKYPPMSEEEIKQKYIEIRESYGDDAKSSAWMVYHGFGWFYRCVQSRFESWYEFKKQMGFNDESSRKPYHSKQELIERYQEVRGKHEDNAKNSRWMIENGYSWLYQRVSRQFGSWDGFKKQAGFEDRKTSNYSKQELIDEYVKIREEYGDRAKICSWMDKNGFSWVYRQGKKKFGSWKIFKKEAGFEDSKKPVVSSASQKEVEH